MSRVPYLALTLPVAGALVLLANAGEPTESARSDEHNYSVWLSDHDENWKNYMRRAGQPNEGVAAEAFVTPREPEIGKPVMFVVSYKNLYQRPAGHWQLEEGGPEEVLMQDVSARPVPLGKKARGAWLGIRVTNTLPDYILVEPGFAIAEKMPLDEYFDLSKPGRYAVLGWGARPVTFELRKPGHKASATTSSFSVYRPGGSFEEKWKHAMVAAGQPHDDLLLECVVSPIDRRAVNLVVSLRNVCTSGKIAPGWACSVSEKYACAFASLRDSSPGVDAKVGIRASEYRILVKEVSGKAVALTEDGKKWLNSHRLTTIRPLRPGEAFGFVFPLDVMFAIKPGHEYSVLVILPGKAAEDPAWIASPVKIRTPELELAGVTRPAYGSSRMWERLAAMAAMPRADASLESTVQVHGDDVLLHMKLENLTGDLIRLDTGKNEREIVLLRGSNGAPLFTNGNATSITPRWISTNEVLYPRGFVPTGGRYRSSAANADYPLEMVFSLRRGATYTVLTAVNLTLDEEFIEQPYHTPEFAKAKDFSALVVAKPVAFSVPLSDSDAPEGKQLSSPTLPVVPRKSPPTFDEQWEAASRFAGKPFEGLLLQASAGGPRELKVDLCNRSDKGLIVQKWKGDSDYEILVRDSAGKPVPLTEKGRKSFQSGELLDIIPWLKPGAAVHASLPLAELFAMQSPGEYTILASLPIMGTIDAVLTAAPVKIRIDAPKAEPQPKK